MQSAAFLLLLKRRARAKPPDDPILAARSFLSRYGDTAEGQALPRVIAAVALGTGEFHESDEWLFSQRTSAVAAD